MGAASKLAAVVALARAEAAADVSTEGGVGVAGWSFCMGAEKVSRETRTRVATNVDVLRQSGGLGHHPNDGSTGPHTGVAVEKR